MKGLDQVRFQRAAAAFLAISRRFFGLRFFARFFAPALPILAASLGLRVFLPMAEGLYLLFQNTTHLCEFIAFAAKFYELAKIHSSPIRALETKAPEVAISKTRANFMLTK
jgi:hypothetical protein